MKLLKIFVLIAVLVGITCVEQMAFAAGEQCKVSYTREACPGKEKESYAKCNGEKSCVKIEAASSEIECLKAGIKACENARLKETKSKVITVTWGEKKLKGGKDFCNPQASDFNKCDK